MPTPQEQPLLAQSDLTYLGSFTLPIRDGSTNSSPIGNLDYGGVAGMGEDGESLYYVGHVNTSQLARVSIPALGGVASVVRQCVWMPTASFDPDGGRVDVGGALVWNGRLIVTGYTYYDGDGDQTHSSFVFDPNIGNRQGPFKFTWAGGWTGQGLGLVPEEWRDLLGGPAFCWAAGLTIISRSSYGPSFHTFDPDLIGPTPCPVHQLIGYPQAHPYADFNTADAYGGVAVPQGWRSALVIRRHGSQSTYCYGDGDWPTGAPECPDPTDGSKGPHAFPYRHEVLAYDLNDLAAVKAGTKQPWDVIPYATWTLPEMVNNGYARMKSAVYDIPSRRWFITAFSGSGAPRVHVYQTAEPPPPTIPDVDCDGTWGEWMPIEDWGPCVKVDGVWQQTRVERREFFVSTEPTGNGSVCPVSPESRDVTQPCTPPPITLTVEVVSPHAVEGDAQFAIVKADHPETPLPVGTTWTVDVPQE